MKTRIYTDGACSGNPGPGGWAALILCENKRVTLSSSDRYTTNNRMELLAAIRAIDWCIKNKYKKIEIYSDSAYVVNSINKEWIKKWKRNFWKNSKGDDVKNRDLWELLNEQLHDLSHVITFVKVRGHSGDKNNDYVDKVAKSEVEAMANQLSEERET